MASNRRRRFSHNCLSGVSSQSCASQYAVHTPSAAPLNPSQSCSRGGVFLRLSARQGQTKVPATMFASPQMRARCSSHENGPLATAPVPSSQSAQARIANACWLPSMITHTCSPIPQIHLFDVICTLLRYLFQLAFAPIMVHVFDGTSTGCSPAMQSWRRRFTSPRVCFVTASPPSSRAAVPGIKRCHMSLLKLEFNTRWLTRRFRTSAVRAHHPTDPARFRSSAKVAATSESSIVTVQRLPVKFVWREAASTSDNSRYRGTRRTHER